MTRATTEATVRYFLRRDQWTQEGPFTLNDILKIFRRVNHDGYTGDSLYRRLGNKEWKPLRAFAHFEFAEPEFRLGELRRLGIKYVEWLTAGLPDECAACKKLDGKIFSVDAPPPIPPVDCQCELCCKCILVAAKNPSVDIQ